jgi:Phage integrase family
VSALPVREPAGRRAVPGSIAAAQWVQIRAAAATIQRYLQRLAAFLAPASVNAAENALRQFARWMIADAGLDSIAAVRRDDIEDYKVWLAVRPRAGGQAITAETHPGSGSVPYASSPGRVIEWDWPDAPPRNPVIAGDIPKKPDPLPKFPRRPRCRQADGRRPGQRRPPRPARGRAAGPHRHASRRAGRPVGRCGRAHRRRELAAHPAGQGPQRPLRPAAPELTDLLAAWTAANLEHIRRCKRLVADHRGPRDRYLIGRIVARVGRAAGVPGVHPHRLRHTLATQAINRGMRLEAITALLGHRKMEMTLIYARIANRVVADEYAQVSAKIDALYGQPPGCPPTTRAPAWPGCAANPMPACSATACAPAQPSWTAAWNPPARRAPTSAPAPSSCPSWSASATTPATTARPTGPPRSTGSSSTPKPDPPPPTPDGADRHARHHP